MGIYIILFFLLSLNTYASDRISFDGIHVYPIKSTKQLEQEYKYNLDITLAAGTNTSDILNNDITATIKKSYTYSIGITYSHLFSSINRLITNFEISKSTQILNKQTSTHISPPIEISTGFTYKHTLDRKYIDTLWGQLYFNQINTTAISTQQTTYLVTTQTLSLLFGTIGIESVISQKKNPLILKIGYGYMILPLTSNSTFQLENSSGYKYILQIEKKVTSILSLSLSYQNISLKGTSHVTRTRISTKLKYFF